jgi:hypothetical protein
VQTRVESTAQAAEFTPSAKNPRLRVCPERPRHAQQLPPLPREPQCLDPPVRIGHTFDNTIALEKVHAAGERRLVDGERHG